MICEWNGTHFLLFVQWVDSPALSSTDEQDSQAV